MIRATIVLLLLSVASTACDGDSGASQPDPSPTATPSVTGPLAPEEAITRAHLETAGSFELDVATGKLYVVDAPPRTAGAAGGEPPLTSPDGAWSYAIDYFDVVVSGGGSVHRIVSAVPVAWSDEGNRLYMREFVVCYTPAIFVFDAPSGELTALGRPQNYVISPDGSMLALYEARSDRAEELHVIDTSTGEVLAALPGAPPGVGGALIPEGWTPEGRLALRYIPGRDVCDLPESDLPTPLPTTHLAP